MKSIFDKNTYENVLERLANLNANIEPKWGKMSAAQMCKHCQFPLELALEKITLPKPNPLAKLFFKSFKKGMYNNKPWKKNLPTVKMFKVTQDFDFATQRDKLQTLITAMYEDRNRTQRAAHPAFGQFTTQQWGQMQYKHLDHHFTQFGI